eukprot:RCo028421
MEYFRAAARCDIAVVKASPVPLDERSIIEEEVKARQWDTLAERAEKQELFRDPAHTNAHDAQLEVIRQREIEERMRMIRLEEKRKQAVVKKEQDRQVREELERKRLEELEMARLRAIEQKRQEMAEEREQSRLKAEQKLYEQQQRRLMRSVPAKSVDEQASELPEDGRSLSSMERMRMEKERLGRMAKLYDGKVSISALYEGALDSSKPKQTGKTQLEMDITMRQRMEEERLRALREEIQREEEEAHRNAQARLQAQRQSKRLEHQQWLAAHQDLGVAAEEPVEDTQPHPIDVLHKRVQASILAEQDAAAVMEENLRWGYSTVDRLEELMEAEREAWRQQLQYERTEQAVSPGVLEVTENWRLKSGSG